MVNPKKETFVGGTYGDRLEMMGAYPRGEQRIYVKDVLVFAGALVRQMLDSAEAVGAIKVERFRFEYKVPADPLALNACGTDAGARLGWKADFTISLGDKPSI